MLYADCERRFFSPGLVLEWFTPGTDSSNLRGYLYLCSGYDVLTCVFCPKPSFVVPNVVILFCPCNTQKHISKHTFQERDVESRGSALSVSAYDILVLLRNLMRVVSLDG